MIQKLILSLLLLAASLSHAQETRKSTTIRFDAPCGDSAQLGAILNEYQELPMIEMASERNNGTKIQHTAILFVNPKTQTYTLVEQISEDLFCVISTGKGLTPYIKPNSK